MERIYSGHITDTSQIIKTFGKKINEDLTILNTGAAIFGLLPSLILISLIGFGMFHLGWKMSVIILLFAPLPTFIRLIGTAKKVTLKKLILNRRVKIYASVNEKPGMWLLLICISLNNKVLIRQWKLQTSQFRNPEVDSKKPLKLLK